MGNLGEKVVSTGFKKSSKQQKIAQSGHTATYLLSTGYRLEYLASFPYLFSVIFHTQARLKISPKSGSRQKNPMLSIYPFWSLSLHLEEQKISFVFYLLKKYSRSYN